MQKLHWKGEEFCSPKLVQHLLDEQAAKLKDQVAKISDDRVKLQATITRRNAEIERLRNIIDQQQADDVGHAIAPDNEPAERNSTVFNISVSGPFELAKVGDVFHLSVGVTK